MSMLATLGSLSILGQSSAGNGAGLFAGGLFLVFVVLAILASVFWIWM